MADNVSEAQNASLTANTKAGFGSLISRASGQSILYPTVLCLIVLLHGQVFWFLQKRNFDQDEFFHLHSAWSIFKGLVPYRDFFQHHMPLYYFFIAPVFQFFSVETKVSDAVAALFFLRTLMWLLSGVILLLTFWLGKLWRNAQVGLIGVFFLVATEAYWNTSMEIRPEPLAVAFWLFYLILFVRAAQPNQTENKRGRLFVLSGASLAIGFLTAQKLVYAFPGVALGTLWYLFSHSASANLPTRFKHVAYQLGGFCVPLILIVAYFYRLGALNQFIQYNFFFNLGLPGFSPFPKLHAFLYQQPYLAFFGCFGLFYATYMLSRSSAQSGEFILLPNTLALLVGLFLIPVPHEQYYLLFLPLLGLFAAQGLLEAVTRLINLRRVWSVRQWILVAMAMSLVLVADLALTAQGMKSPWPPFVIPAYWFSAFLALLALTFFRYRTLALSVFLIVLSAPPLTRLHGALKSTDRITHQIEEIRYTIETTSPTDTIMDGYTGTLVFRPHAHFYWFFPGDVRQTLTEKDKQDILTGLRVGSVAPKLLLFDKNLRDFSPAITAYFEEYYQPVGKGDIWRRKEKA